MISNDLKSEIENFFGSKTVIVDCQMINGGDIHQSYRLMLKGCEIEYLFVKLNSLNNRDALISEYQALNYFKGCDGVRYPKPYSVIVNEAQCALVMEYLLLAPINDECEAALAEMLAIQHQVTDDYFGWQGDNYIGSTCQPNKRQVRWTTFFQRNRLAHQFELSVKRGLPGSTALRVERLLSDFVRLYVDHQPKPALLHGDLWSGNVAQCGGMPILFDPAPYFGDREADIAMTKLFGGFSAQFYARYEQLMPLAHGFEARVSALNLYHALNHFNMFGDSYLPLIDRLLLEDLCVK